MKLLKTGLDMKMIIILLCFILCGIIAIGISCEKNHEVEMRKLTRIEAKVDRRDNLDSMYMDHLSQCSFLTRDDIGIGHNDYLYSKYHRDSGLIR